MPTPVPTSEKYLDIEGFATFCAAWHTLTLAPIERRLDVRGSDLVIPKAPGVKANPRRPTGSERTIPMNFFGDYDCEGNRNTDPAAGLEANLDLFQETVVDPFQTGVLHLATATLHRWDGSTASAEIRVEDFGWDELSDSVAVAELVLFIPYTSFFAVAS